MKTKVLLSLVAVMVVGLLVGCAAPAPAPAPAPTPAPAPAPKPELKPLTLKAVISLPYRPGGAGQQYLDFLERVNQRAKGELIIDFKGGSEVIPAFDQFEAIRSGVVDMGWIFAGSYQKLVPEVSSYNVTELSPTEEREVGYHNYMIEVHKKQAMYYVGRLGSGGFVLWTVKKRVEEPYSGFQGLKVAASGTEFNGFLKKLGAVPTMLAAAEKYTAFERSIVDGNCAAVWGSYALGHGEVLKYCTDHPFWTRGGSSSLMRLESWNKLPKNLQDLIIDEQLNTEKLLGPYFEKLLSEERANLTKQGVQFVKFAPADAKWYLDMSKEAKWEELKTAASPASYSLLRDMLRK